MNLYTTITIIAALVFILIFSWLYFDYQKTASKSDSFNKRKVISRIILFFSFSIIENIVLTILNNVFGISLPMYLMLLPWILVAILGGIFLWNRAESKIKYPPVKDSSNKFEKGEFFLYSKLIDLKNIATGAINDYPKYHEDIQNINKKIDTFKSDLEKSKIDITDKVHDVMLEISNSICEKLQEFDLVKKALSEGNKKNMFRNPYSMLNQNEKEVYVKKYSHYINNDLPEKIKSLVALMKANKRAI